MCSVSLSSPALHAATLPGMTVVMADWGVQLISNLSSAVLGAILGGAFAVWGVMRTLRHTERQREVESVEAAVANLQSASIRASLLSQTALKMSRFSREKARLNDRLAAALADFGAAMYEARAATARRWPGMSAEINSVLDSGEGFAKLSEDEAVEKFGEFHLQTMVLANRWLEDHDVFEAGGSFPIETVEKTA